MKICTFTHQTQLGQISRLGFYFKDETIVDVNLAWKAKYDLEGRYLSAARADANAPSRLSTILKTKDNPIAFFQETADLFEKLAKAGHLTTKDGASVSFDLRDAKKTKLSCPLDSINMYRDFYAHEKHVRTSFEKRKEEIPAPWFEIPVYYKGGIQGFIGPEEDLLWPSYTQKLDYELELAAIIGKEGKNIKANKALDHIFGYTVLNDVSARDIQRKEMQCRLGPSKGKDFCSVLGPVIVTADEFQGKEPNLTMTATINGEEWSHGQSGDSRYSWGEMIEFLSMDEWIMPTDLLGSGTVGTGCGLEIDKWIQPGDSIVLEIEKIGKLRNRVGVPQRSEG